MQENTLERLRQYQDLIKANENLFINQKNARELLEKDIEDLNSVNERLNDRYESYTPNYIKTIVDSFEPARNILNDRAMQIDNDLEILNSELRVQEERLNANDYTEDQKKTDAAALLNSGEDSSSIREKYDALNERLETETSIREDANSIIQNLQTRIDAVNSEKSIIDGEISKSNDALEQLKNNYIENHKMHNDENVKALLENEIEQLNKVIEMGEFSPENKISEIISNYEAGSISEEEVENELNNLKDKLELLSLYKNSTENLRNLRENELELIDSRMEDLKSNIKFPDVKELFNSSVSLIREDYKKIQEEIKDQVNAMTEETNMQTMLDLTGLATEKFNTIKLLEEPLKNNGRINRPGTSKLTKELIDRKSELKDEISELNQNLNEYDSSKFFEDVENILNPTQEIKPNTGLGDGYEYAVNNGEVTRGLKAAPFTKEDLMKATKPKEDIPTPEPVNNSGETTYSFDLDALKKGFAAQKRENFNPPKPGLFQRIKEKFGRKKINSKVEKYSPIKETLIQKLWSTTPRKVGSIVVSLALVVGGTALVKSITGDKDIDKDGAFIYDPFAIEISEGYTDKDKKEGKTEESDNRRRIITASNNGTGGSGASSTTTANETSTGGNDTGDSDNSKGNDGNKDKGDNKGKDKPEDGDDDKTVDDNKNKDDDKATDDNKDRDENTSDKEDPTDTDDKNKNDEKDDTNIEDGESDVDDNVEEEENENEIPGDGVEVDTENEQEVVEGEDGNSEYADEEQQEQVQVGEWFSYGDLYTLNKSFGIVRDKNNKIIAHIMDEDRIKFTSDGKMYFVYPSSIAELESLIELNRVDSMEDIIDRINNSDGIVLSDEDRKQAVDLGDKELSGDLKDLQDELGEALNQDKDEIIDEDGEVVTDEDFEEIEEALDDKADEITPDLIDKAKKVDESNTDKGEDEDQQQIRDDQVNTDTNSETKVDETNATKVKGTDQTPEETTKVKSDDKQQDGNDNKNVDNSKQGDNVQNSDHSNNEQKNNNSAPVKNEEPAGAPVNSNSGGSSYTAPKQQQPAATQQTVVKKEEPAPAEVKPATKVETESTKSTEGEVGDTAKAMTYDEMVSMLNNNTYGAPASLEGASRG